MLKSTESAVGRDLLLVDLRRNDHEVRLPMTRNRTSTAMPGQNVTSRTILTWSLRVARFAAPSTFRRKAFIQPSQSSTAC